MASKAEVSNRKSWITAFKVKARVMVQNINKYLDPLNCRTCCGYRLGMVMQLHRRECHAEKKYLLLSRSRSQQGLIRSKYDSTISSELLILWQANLVWASCEKKIDYHIRGQGHSKGSRCQWMFGQMIAFKPLNILLPYLVWWYIIMSWNVMHKDRLAIFKVKITTRAHTIKMWVFTISELLILLLPDLVWWYINISQSVLWRNYIAVFKVKVTDKLQNINECLSKRCLECLTFYLVLWCIIISLKLSKKICLLWSKSQWRII